MAQSSKKRKAIEMDDELIEVLECPVCLKMPRQTPVYQCENGHCICSECYVKLTNCPICRKALGKIRNLVFERLLKKMSHKCKFVEYGCTFEDTMKPLECHELDCQYRLVNCVHLTCKIQISMAHLFEHMQKEHNRIVENTVLNEYQRIKSSLHVKTEDFIEEGIWKPAHIKFEDKHFFLESWRSTTGQWSFWVYMIGSKEACDEWTYTMKLKSKKKKEMQIYRARGYCVPLDLTKEQVAMQGICFTLTDAAVKWLIANDRLKYSITIESVGMD